MVSDRPHVTVERALDAPLLSFDIPALLARIKAETWRKGTHEAMTLAKSRGLRVVLVAMHVGTVLPSHRADGPISFQVIDGELRFRTDSQSLTLKTGELVTLQAGIHHAIEAVNESAFLLTLSMDTPHPAEH
jgi:quercetin dioxygenase-like cupin family protein